VPVDAGETRAGNSKASVAVEIDSLGDETVALFSLSFDASILSNPVVALADGEMPEGIALTANTARAADGCVTILIDSVTPLETAYAKRLLFITFDVAKNTSSSDIRVTFDGSGSFSDAAANSLDAVYEDGTSMSGHTLTADRMEHFGIRRSLSPFLRPWD
jgi:hypothetical protein